MYKFFENVQKFNYSNGMLSIDELASYGTGTLSMVYLGTSDHFDS